MSALENARNEGKIGASLQAALKVHVSADVEELFDGLDAASLFITSAAVITNVPHLRMHSSLMASTMLPLPLPWQTVRNVPVAGGSRQRLQLRVDICKRCQKVVAAVR